MSKKVYVALDIETTGLDPANDHILEIGWVVADEKFEEISPRRSFIIEHKEGWGDVFHTLKSNEYVRRMHEDSGLLSDLMEKTGYEVDDVREVLVADIEEYKRYGCSAHLLGFSVGFDKSFLTEWHGFWGLFGDDLDSVFNHRVMDLSSLKLMYEASGLEVPEVITNTRKHRALDDALEALNFAREVRKDFTEGRL